ncbi:protein misato-like 1-like [Quillaja saponaria]|nr:protein misato-like 1-like [Quillaja saponaria]
MDDSGGFSSVAADFLENIADEYTNTPILLFSVRGPTPDINPESRKQAVSRDLHDAVSFSRLSPYCKLIVPTGLPRLSGSKASRFLNIVDEKPYHCSAVYAAALLSISLPFRMEPVGPTASSSYVSGAMDVNEVVQMLAGQARQNMVQILDVAMPAPSLSGKQNEMTLLENLLPLTPDVAENVEDLQAVEFMTVLGALSAEGHRASVSQVRDLVHAAFQHIDTRPVFFHLAVSLCPLPIPLTFPSIFSNLVGQQGELVGSPISESSSRGSLDVHSIPMAARLRSSSAVLPLLQSRLRNLHGLGIQRGAPGAQLLRSWGFEKDELEEMGEMLSKMVVALDSHQISSDSD